MNTIKEYLDYYSEIQPIEVVYRPNQRVDWGRNRKIYDGNCNYEYNHRSILDCEVVFDFDDGKYDINLAVAKEVMSKLDEDEISYQAWNTGNKGIHIHILFEDLNKAKDLSLMKRTILKHYAWGKNIDYQLSGKHLVRMEFGIHEKKRDSYKSCLSGEGATIKINRIPIKIWTEYTQAVLSQINRKVKVENPEIEGIVKDIISCKIVLRDGRKNMLWFLIHQLKGKMDQDKVMDTLISWYHYQGGTELTDEQIRRQVRYQWDKTYGFSKSWLDTLLQYSVRTDE